MARKKLTLDFPLYDTLKTRLDEIGGDATKNAVESALKKSHDFATSQLASAMIPHNKTNTVSGSLSRDSQVEWTGTEAFIKVGFNIAEGGLPSIFLMYGTKIHGQPHVTPDRKLYDALYGAAAKNQIQKIQEDAFFGAIEKVMKE